MINERVKLNTQQPPERALRRLLSGAMLLLREGYR